MKLLDGYMFRGHADKTWKLKTNIERAGEQHQQNPFNLYSFEKVIIEKFISRAHQYIQSLPNKDETFEWLSLLQDYGDQLDCWILRILSILRLFLRLNLLNKIPAYGR
jgi:hypothetical protein